MAKKATPNVFELAGGGSTITWTPAAIDGKPLLTYDDRSFRGTEVRQSNSPLGKLVTAVVEAVPDARTTSLTLVVPRVNLGTRTEAKVRTIAVLKVEATTIGGPGLVQGQVDTYKVLKLSGFARSVES